MQTARTSPPPAVADKESASSMTTDIRPVETPADRKAFIRFPNALYEGDPNYIAPLEFELEARLDGKKNPGLKDSPYQLWVAYRNGVPVGRISALVNRAHLDFHKDDTGHFGFIEFEDDPSLVKALIDTAADWLRAKGMKKIAGPFNFSVNEETGLLVDGFDTPPYIAMPHGKPYYAARLEELGFTKAMDMHALEYYPVRDFIPAKRMRFVQRALDKPEVSKRTLKSGDMVGDIKIIHDINNDAR